MLCLCRGHVFFLRGSVFCPEGIAYMRAVLISEINGDVLRRGLVTTGRFGDTTVVFNHYTGGLWYILLYPNRLVSSYIFSSLFKSSRRS